MNREANPIQLINSLIEKKLNENVFECTPETSNFLNENIGYVINNFSLKTMAISVKTYESMIDKLDKRDAKFTLMEASVIINGVERSTPAMMLKDPRLLVEVFQNCNAAAKEWNKIVEPIKRSCEREINAKIERKIIKPNNGIRPGTGLKINKN